MGCIFEQSFLFDFRLCDSKREACDHKAVAGEFIDLEVNYQLALMGSQHFTPCLGTP